MMDLCPQEKKRVGLKPLDEVQNGLNGSIFFWGGGGGNVTTPIEIMLNNNCL